MKAVSGVYWDTGVRKSNQDSLLYQQVMTCRGRVILAAVSDGIGGLSEGEKASGFIVEKLAECFYSQLLPLVSRGKGKKFLIRAIKRCLYDICTELSQYAGGRGIRLGATLSLLLVWRRRYLTVHLGDSRIYLMHRAVGKLLTTDHSDGGQGLMKCVGSFPFQTPDISAGRLRGRKGFLLASDGFYRKMGEQMGEVLDPGDIHSSRQIARRLSGLGEMAQKRGEKDNLSALYVLLYEGGV